ncbi:hypothetical protein [Streptomyces chattanoogensis]|uniref:hypothetical protein n=1 Tax=Streptomyces chattanoogensis TaxID=66876 RepID=UPI003692E4B1
MPTDPADAPVSPAQRERLTLWASGRPSQDQPTFAWSFPCAVSPSRARSVWEAVVARYDTLRSVFADGGDGTFRCRREPAAAIAAQTFVETSPEEFFDALCAPVALLGGALARLVVSPGRDETLIGLSIDHLVIDGQCYHRVVAEFFAGLRGEEPAGPAPVRPDAFYRDELSAAGSPAGDKVLAYWRRTTGGRTYPPLHAGLARPAGAAVVPETAHATVGFGPSAASARAPLTRSATVLAAVCAGIAETLDLPADGETFAMLLQSSRRSSPETAAMAGFLSNWQVTTLPVGRRAEELVEPAGSAIFRAARGHHLHHAEVVRRLEPALYGARYLPSEPLPPYALFNYLTEQDVPEVNGVPGTPLEVPPMGAYRLHGALRVYGTERADGSGAEVRLVADASVFGGGFAAAVAKAVTAGSAVRG